MVTAAPRNIRNSIFSRGTYDPRILLGRIGSSFHTTAQLGQKKVRLLLREFLNQLRRRRASPGPFHPVISGGGQRALNRPRCVQSGFNPPFLRSERALDQRSTDEGQQSVSGAAARCLAQPQLAAWCLNIIIANSLGLMLLDETRRLPTSQVITVTAPEMQVVPRRDEDRSDIEPVEERAKAYLPGCLAAVRLLARTIARPGRR